MSEEKPEIAANSKYNETVKTCAFNLYRKGWTDKQVARVIGVCEKTINNWKKKYPDFFLSVKEAKADPDKQVEDALFLRATGYSFPSEELKTVNHGKDLGSSIERFVTTKIVIPDPGAAMNWLTNRKKNEWANTQKIELPDLDKLSDDDLRALIKKEVAGLDET